MIDLVTGPPGSGKSYFMVKKIYDVLVSKKKRYKYIYTNINGFDFEKANQLAGMKKYVQPLDFDDLRKYMIEEYNFHEKIKSGLLDTQGDDYDTFLKKLGVFAPYQNSLLVIDEAHLLFPENVDQVSLRFITYHRHFGIDILMATQNKNLISKKYLVCIETLYKALPSHKRFFSHIFRYKVFASYQEYNSNLIKSISLKLDYKVSSLYHSGSTKLNKSALKVFVFPLIVLSLFIYLFYNFFIAEKYNYSVEQNKEVFIPANFKSNNVNNDFDKTKHNTNYYFITCYTNFCKFKDIDFSFDEHSLFSVFRKFNCEVVFKQFNGKFYSNWLIECNSDLDKFLNIFKKGVPSDSDRSIFPNVLKD